MAIEAVDGAMSLQAQTTQKISTQLNAPAEGKASPSIDPVSYVDNTTRVIDKPDNDNQSYMQNNDDYQQNNEQIIKAVSQLNKRIGNSEAVYGIHEGTNRVTIKIVDKSTKEIIKELPPEKTLDMIARVWEMAGILVDEKR